MNKRIRGYIGRFTLIHVITYVVCGIIFMELLNYEESLATMESFKLYRSLEDPMVGLGVFPMQILRGGLFALLIYPFYKRIIEKRHGWLLLFGLLYGFTYLFIALPEFLSGIVNYIRTGTSIAELFVGVPEITVQMLVFSLVLFKWERRVRKNQRKSFARSNN